MAKLYKKTGTNIRELVMDEGSPNIYEGELYKVKISAKIRGTNTSAPTGEVKDVRVLIRGARYHSGGEIVTARTYSNPSSVTYDYEELCFKCDYLYQISEGSLYVYEGHHNGRYIVANSVGSSTIHETFNYSVPNPSPGIGIELLDSGFELKNVEITAQLLNPPEDKYGSIVEESYLDGAVWKNVIPAHGTKTINISLPSDKYTHGTGVFNLNNPMETPENVRVDFFTADKKDKAMITGKYDAKIRNAGNPSVFDNGSGSAVTTYDAFSTVTSAKPFSLSKPELRMGPVAVSVRQISVTDLYIGGEQIFIKLKNETASTAQLYLKFDYVVRG